MKTNKLIGIAVVLSFALFAFFIIENRPPNAEDIEDKITSSVGKEITAEATAIGNISHQSVKSDTAISTIIDSSQKLDNGNLLVKFHHNSNKEEPVSVIGNVRYELSKTIANPNEEITLIVFDWSTEYFEIKIGKTSSIVGFGKKSESLDNDEVVLRELAKQGIDKKDVVLEKDYGRRLTKAEKEAKSADPARRNEPDPSPYSKTYKDTKSGKNILVASGLMGIPVSLYTKMNNIIH